MQHYKTYHVYTRAVCKKGAWRGKGIVLDAGAKVNRQLMRIETVPDLLFLSKQEAEEFAFNYCKHWIDTEKNRNH